jgi:hypothetical protein
MPRPAYGSSGPKCLLFSRIVTTTGMNKLNVLISHSIPLKTSVVQVLAEGQMTLVAHLVGKETIGDQIHIGLQFVSLFSVYVVGPL